MTATMKKQKFKYDLIACLWDDAHSDSAWKELSEVKLEECIVVTVGFLINEDADRILIADSYVAEKDHILCISGTTQVPRGMIKSLEVIRKGK
jgi:hypothetical protein